ncbi:MAG: methyl-accepting chemotaxis protein [Thiohalomonadaceae bacterium]
MNDHTNAIQGLSIRSKVSIALAAGFVLILISSQVFVAFSERKLIEHVIAQQTLDTADSYFDSFNILMLTGTMDNRAALRQKILERPGILDARLLRHESISQTYGPGLPEEAPVDELDRRGLAGEKILRIDETEQGRVLTVVEPVRASENYRGTNCLTCHQVPAGSVVGAVRISFSLQDLDKQINRDLLASGGIQLGLFVAGFVVLFTLLQRMVIGPINRVRNTMEDIERDSDLSRHIEVTSRDEVGRMAEAFNRMVAKFRESLSHVSEATQRLAGSAGRVSEVSHATVQAVLEQQRETDQVATAMNEMTSTVQEVARNATRTADASQGANNEARKGALVATEALGGIEVLMQQIQSAADAVHELDEKSEGINTVLEVIRSIAEQTNLLALNAAIEAARAGEQGRGFAVVADEVRSLANRSHGATEEIRQLIDQLHTGVRDAVRAMGLAEAKAKEGSDMVEHSAEALGAIAGEVSTISDMNAQIATAAEEQSAVAEEINRNVTNISQLADQTSEGARQTSRVSEELVGLAEQLQAAVSRFRV